MLQNFVFQRATDNVAPDATVAVQSGTEDATYPAANINDQNPAKPAQLTTTVGAWTWNFAAPQRIDVMAIVMHNVDAGLEVRFQGHTSNSWGSPTLNQVVTIPTYREDGFPYNPWLDLVALVPVAASRTFAWWRLVVVGTNSAAVKVGEVWLGATKRNLIRNIKWGSTRNERRPGVVHETDYLVRLKYDYGVLRRAVTVEIENTDISLEDVLSWGRSCRWGLRPCLIVPNPDQNDAWLVNFATTEQDYDRTLKNYNVMKLSLEEMSRGLVL